MVKEPKEIALIIDDILRKGYTDDIYFANKQVLLEKEYDKLIGI